MSRALATLSAFNRKIARACLFGSAFGLALMTVIIGWQVFARYVLNDSPHWSEKFCLLLMIYYILFAAAAGVRDKTHIGLTFLETFLPARLYRILSFFTQSMMALFGGAMIWYGAQMAWTTRDHVIPTLGVSTGLNYLPFPLAGILFVLFSVEHLLALAAGKEVEASWS